MKKLSFLFLIALAIASCDKVPSRIPPEKPLCTLDSAIMVVRTNSLVSNTRKVLLEDYTGHTCGNCPRAAEKAEELSKTYGNKLVVIANHVSKTFAAPKGAYLEDFRDPAATEWDDGKNFGMSNAGLPKGTVNRMLVNGAYPQNFGAWATNVASELSKPQSVKLDVTSTYDPGQKLLNVKVFSTFKQALSANVYLSMVLTMDSIITNQTDYTPPAGVTVVDNDRRPDYRFDHIMVKSLNGSWGQLVKSGPIAVNDTASVVKNCNSITKCFYTDQTCTDDSRMYLVVFAYNETTKEVLQVEKVKIK